MTVTASVSVGVVGLGYWGPNLARNFAAIEDCELRWCCDALPERAGKAPPGTRVTTELGDLLSDPELDAVIVATDVPGGALPARSGSASQHQRSSQSSMAAKFRARFGPQ